MKFLVFPSILTLIIIIVLVATDLSTGQLQQQMKQIWSNWTESVKQLKKRVRNAYEKKTLTIHEHVGIGPKPSAPIDYPGFDQQKINSFKEMWLNYYACLQVQVKVLGDDRMMTPQATTVIAGENIK